jgi:glycerol kinase
MAAQHILAIDEGTTGVRALITDATGTIRSEAYQPIDTRYPAPGLVEHDAESIWASTVDVMRAALSTAGVTAADIAAVGVATQRATVVLWDAGTGRAMHTAISWQDQRTALRCEELTAQGHWVNPMGSATKVEWLLANAGSGATDLRAGTIDAWLVGKLTGGRTHVTDPSNASCTLLYDHFGGGWDAGMLDALSIPEDILPRIVPSSGVCGTMAPDILGAEIPVAGIAGDQQAAMFGQLCTERGMVKATFGTSAMFNLHTGDTLEMPPPGTFPLVLWEIDGRRSYCLEGSAITAGAAIQWLAQGLGIIKSPAESDAVARSVPDSGGAWAVPAFQGLGTPHMLAGARALFGGISRGTTHAHLVRALLESIAFRGREVLDTLVGAGASSPLTALRVNGGAARNDFLMQTLADVLGVAVERPTTIEAGAVGAAYLAGRAVGLWRDLDALQDTRRIERVFQPAWSTAEREERWTRWQQVLQVAVNAAQQ